MRDLESGYLDLLYKKVTTPNYLVTINWQDHEGASQGVYTSTTNQDVTYETVDFDDKKIKLNQISPQSMAIWFTNVCGHEHTPALDTKYIDSIIEVRLAYEIAPGTEKAPIIFKGYLDYAHSIGHDWIKAKCFAVPAATLESPRIFAEPPAFNYLPPAGTIIGKYILEPAR